MRPAKANNHPAAILAALAVLLAFAAGCGGGDGDTSGKTSGEKTAAPALTKDDFVKQANAICRKTDETQTSELGTYVKEHPKAEDSKAGQEKMVSAVGLPPVQKEAEELAELGAPKGDEAQVEAIVSGIEAALVKAEADPAAVLESNTPFDAAGKLATKYGLKDCATPQ